MDIGMILEDNRCYADGKGREYYLDYVINRSSIDVYKRQPHQYVLSCRWQNDFPATDRRSFYRMLSYADFHSYFRRLHAAYSAFDSLEDALCCLL